MKSSSIKKALKSVGNYDKCCQCPTYNEIRIAYLQTEVERIDKVDLEKYKEWSRIECALLSDGLMAGNFLVNGPHRTGFFGVS